jgi:hypothetical protein
MLKVLLIAFAICFLAGVGFDALAQSGTIKTTDTTPAPGIASLAISDEELSANAAGTTAITSMPVSETKFSINGTELPAYLIDFDRDGMEDALYVPLSQKELSSPSGLYNLRIGGDRAALAMAIDSNGNGKTDGLLLGPLFSNANLNKATDPATECREHEGCFWTGTTCKCLK